VTYDSTYGTHIPSGGGFQFCFSSLAIS